MNKFWGGLLILAIIGQFIPNPNSSNSSSNYSSGSYRNDSSDIDKILKAKNIVRTMVNFPDTLSFHEFETKVNGGLVTLKFTAKNAFGVPETNIVHINVN